jgi:phosphate transport system permease protein
MLESVLQTRYSSRRRRNFIATGLAYAATVFGVGWLVLILGALLWKGFSGLTIAVFTEMTPPPGSAGGLLNAIFGSLILTTLAVLIGTPVGVLAGTYLAEYGRHDRLSSVVRFINDILLSAPSIVVGLFIYEVMVYPLGHFSGWAGGVALAVIVRGANHRRHADAGAERLARSRNLHRPAPFAGDHPHLLSRRAGRHGDRCLARGRAHQR